MHYKSIEIFNFQAHEHLKVDFVDGFNVLVGTSNVGKSAVLRALRWVLTNNPTGDKFITHGKDVAKVVLELDNGLKIERERGRGKKKTTNYYRLYRGEELLSEHTGFGNNVPQEIEDVTFSEESFDILFAHQLESTFLLSDSPSVRAQRLGGFEDFSKIDTASAETKSEAAEAKKLANASKKRVKELEIELKEIEGELSELEPKLLAVNELFDSVIELEQSYQSVSGLVDNVKNIESNITTLSNDFERANKITESAGDIDKEIDVYEKLVAVYSELEVTSNIIHGITFKKDELLNEWTERIQDIEGKINNFNLLKQTLDSLQSNEQAINNIPKWNEKIANLTFEDVEMQITIFNELKQINDSLVDNQNKIKELNVVIDTTNERTLSLMDDFAKMIQEYEVCPTCTQNTKTVDVELIKSNL